MLPFGPRSRTALVRERYRDGVADDDWLTQLSHVVALAVVVELVGPLAVSPKVAFRDTTVSLVDKETGDRALVGALRGDVHLTESWDVGVEGRTCGSPGSGEPTRYGALADVSVLALGWLRLGAGYNFSQISASGVRCQEADARGAFVRAEAVY